MELCPICGLPAVDGHKCAEGTGSARQRLASRTPGGAMTSLVGRILGRTYRVVEPIGAGAMGVVYVVEHTTLKKRFAAKILNAELARHPESVARFEVEAHAASLLDHENIVSVIDFGKTEDGCVFIIMELLPGSTLQARMDRGPVSTDEVVAIMLQVCRALAVAHAAGIVHRDMKPDNIFLTQRPGGRPMVKVLDFGISKARESPLCEARITKQGQLLGSPEYMSPEASRGDEVDARADIYAVGVILYELLCGVVPFRHENYLKVLQMHIGEPPRPPRELAPDLPQGVERLILRALAKDPDRRQGSIDELEEELLEAMPDAAQRAHIQARPLAHREWFAGSTLPLPYVGGTGPGLAELSRPASGTHDGGETTVFRRRRGRRRLVAAMWSATAVMMATAAVVVLWKPSLSGRAGEVAARAPDPEIPSASVQPSAPSVSTGVLVETEPPAADPGRPARRARDVRLRIATAPPGALVTLEGKRLGRTPLDIRVAAADRAGQVALQLRGYKSTTRSVPLDRNGEIHLSLEREPRRSISGWRRENGSGTGGKSGGKGAGVRNSARGHGDGERHAERLRAADLDIKEGR